MTIVLNVYTIDVRNIHVKTKYVDRLLTLILELISTSFLESLSIVECDSTEVKYMGSR